MIVAINNFGGNKNHINLGLEPRPIVFETMLCFCLSTKNKTI